MADIILTSDEQAALMGLSYLPIVLYVMAIRPRMDFATGFVGVTVGVSWQALGEWCYIEPHSGIKSGSPDRSSIRRAAETLERAGLLSINSSGKRLIFKCNLAKRDNCARKKPDTNPTHQTGTQADTPKAAPLLGESTKRDTQADTPKTAQADTHPLSDIYTPIPPPPIQSPVVGAGVEYAQIIKPEQRPAIEQYLLKIDQATRQDMLDDLAGYMQIKADKGDKVKNPAGVLARMVSRYRNGEYVADSAYIGRNLRLQRDIFDQSIATPAPQTERKPKPPPAQARAAIDKILRKGKHDESGSEANTGHSGEPESALSGVTGPGA